MYMKYGDRTMVCVGTILMSSIVKETPSVQHNAVSSRDAGSVRTLPVRCTHRRMSLISWNTHVCVEYVSLWNWTPRLTLVTVGSGAKLLAWGSWQSAWINNPGASTASSHPAVNLTPPTPTSTVSCVICTGTYWISFLSENLCTWVETRYEGVLNFWIDIIVEEYMILPYEVFYWQ